MDHTRAAVAIAQFRKRVHLANDNPLAEAPMPERSQHPLFKLALRNRVAAASGDEHRHRHYASFIRGNGFDPASQGDWMRLAT